MRFIAEGVRVRGWYDGFFRVAGVASSGEAMALVRWRDAETYLAGCDDYLDVYMEAFVDGVVDASYVFGYEVVLMDVGAVVYSRMLETGLDIAREHAFMYAKDVADKIFEETAKGKTKGIVYVVRFAELEAMLSERIEGRKDRGIVEAEYWQKVRSAFLDELDSELSDLGRGYVRTWVSDEDGWLAIVYDAEQS